jgi:homoserine kinase type II
MSPAAPARITAGELAVALSHYDLGVIESVRRFRGGSRQSPKVVIQTPAGRYLLKRRPPARAGADAARIAFTHEVVLHLARHGFPVPELIGTRAGGNSMLELGTGVYELHRFVEGERYARRPEQALAAGWWQGRCHALLRDLSTAFPAPHRAYHAHPKIPLRLEQLGASLASAAGPATPDASGLCAALSAAYQNAAQRVDALMTGAEQAQVVHGDWHPGNMLFRDSTSAIMHVPARAPRETGLVAGVFDFDAARLGLALHDLANGAMQFAVHRHVTGDQEAGAWRIALDPGLLRAFFAGYGGAAGPLPEASRLAVPWLMIEALIVEVVVPVAATGSFGKLPALPMLAVVLRAVEAMAAQADRLVACAGEPYSS